MEIQFPPGNRSLPLCRCLMALCDPIEVTYLEMDPECAGEDSEEGLRLNFLPAWRDGALDRK